MSVALKRASCWLANRNCPDVPRANGPLPPRVRRRDEPKLRDRSDLRQVGARARPRIARFGGQTSGSHGASLKTVKSWPGVVRGYSRRRRRHVPTPPNPIRIASEMARPLAEVAGAGAEFGSQMPLTHFSEAHSAGVMQLPPFGTRVLVGVIDGVNVDVLVAVIVAVLVVVAVFVAVAVLVGVLDGVAVGVTVGVLVSQAVYFNLCRVAQLGHEGSQMCLNGVDDAVSIHEQARSPRPVFGHRPA